MKKIILILAILVVASAGMAQKSERTNAFMYNKNGQYDKAREAIDKAIVHEKTASDPKAWFYRGVIYLNIVFTEQFAKIDPQALDKSYASFLKVMELDPNDKEAQLVEIKPRIEAIGQQYFVRGVERFNNQEFNAATTEFIQSFNVAKSINKVDTLALLNAGLASIRAENYEQALNYYNQLLQLKFSEPDVYRNMATAYRGLDNKEKMMETIKYGRALYPSDNGLILEEINAYLAIGQGARVVNDLINLVEQDPTNYSIYFVLGTIYGDEANAAMYNLATAAKYYEKAIEYKADYYDAIYNIGALYINESNKLQVKANDLPLTETKLYDKITEEANVIIRKALPYLEKAYEMQPSNKETIQVLKSIYARFKMNDKLKSLQ